MNLPGPPSTPTTNTCILRLGLRWPEPAHFLLCHEAQQPRSTRRREATTTVVTQKQQAASVLRSHASRSMPKRKQPVQEDVVIFGLDDLLDYRIMQVLYDGTQRKRASLYLVRLRTIVKTSKARKAARTTIVPPAWEGGPYVLKIFPESPENQKDYEREVAANAVLNRQSAASNALAACDALIRMAASAQNSATTRWPLCFGTLRTAEQLVFNRWIRTSPDTDHRSALLFEYIPDLEPLTREIVTEELVEEYMKVLAELHAFKILHRDQILRAAWPQIAFNNLFLRKNKLTGIKEILILDFDKALVLGDTARDKMLLRNEEQELREALEIALSRKDMLESLPDEVKKLLQ